MRDKNDNESSANYFGLTLLSVTISGAFLMLLLFTRNLGYEIIILAIFLMIFLVAACFALPISIMRAKHLKDLLKNNLIINITAILLFYGLLAGADYLGKIKLSPTFFFIVFILGFIYTFLIQYIVFMATKK